jgi:hypothetical protein
MRILVKVAELCGELLFDCLSHEQLLAWPLTFTVCSACCIELIIHTAHPAVVSAEANCAAQSKVTFTCCLSTCVGFAARLAVFRVQAGVLVHPVAAGK